MSETARFDIRPLTDRSTLEELLRLRWSDGTICILGELLAPCDVQALGAFHADRLHGLATFRVVGDTLYLITLNNFTDQRGVSAALLDGVIALARQQGRATLRAIISNDNVDALRFYQRRGLRLVALHPGSIDRVRRFKPSVPISGANGIPMRDELELEIAL